MIHLVRWQMSPEVLSGYFSALLGIGCVLCTRLCERWPKPGPSRGGPPLSTTPFTADGTAAPVVTAPVMTEEERAAKTKRLNDLHARDIEELTADEHAEMEALEVDLAQVEAVVAPRPSDAPGEVPEDRFVYVKGEPWASVVARVIIGPVSKFGWIEFATRKAAKMSLLLNGASLAGYPLVSVDFRKQCPMPCKPSYVHLSKYLPCANLTTRLLFAFRGCRIAPSQHSITMLPKPGQLPRRTPQGELFEAQQCISAKFRGRSRLQCNPLCNVRALGPSSPTSPFFYSSSFRLIPSFCSSFL